MSMPRRRRQPVRRWCAPAPTASGMRETLRAFLAALVLSAPIAAAGGWAMYASWRQREDDRLAAIEAALAHERLVAAPPGPAIETAAAAHGRDLFVTVCAACHSVAGTGVTGLGRNLVESDFVAARTDGELHAFLVTGRPKAIPFPMPPRGGREELTDEDLWAIVAYVRGLQDPRRMPELPAMAAATPSDEQKAAALEAAGGDAELAEYIASGNTLFHSTCVACHGQGGTGIRGNGKALVHNTFIGGLDDDGLLAFIKQGRAPTDAGNTTGIQMPPKGGNPALSDDDILDIIAYLRTLQESTKAAK